MKTTVTHLDDLLDPVIGNYAQQFGEYSDKELYQEVEQLLSLFPVDYIEDLIHRVEKESKRQEITITHERERLEDEIRERLAEELCSQFDVPEINSIEGMLLRDKGSLEVGDWYGDYEIIDIRRYTTKPGSGGVRGEFGTLLVVLAPADFPVEPSDVVTFKLEWEGNQ